MEVQFEHIFVNISGFDKKKQIEVRNRMNETQVEETSNNVSSASINNSTNNNSSNVVLKRTASISSPRTHDPQIYENVEGDGSNSKNRSTTECSAATQTEAKSPLQQQQQQQQQQPQQQQQLQREESFVRTGSGRKLPKIPTAGGGSTATVVSKEEAEVAMKESVVLREADDDDDDKEAKAENRKSKPKALEFWESLINPSKNPVAASMEDIDDEDEDDGEDEMGPPDDFRYNTIHRMSMGRRMLPRPPGTATAAQRSQSLDRNGELAFGSGASKGAGAAAGGANKDSSSSSSSFLNASFSGPSSLPNEDHDPVEPRGRSRTKKGSGDSDGGKGTSPSAPAGVAAASATSVVPQPGQPSPPSSDSRGEVEGSSDNNSPPTSVIQGLGADVASGNPALDWIRGSSFGGKDKVNECIDQFQGNFKHYCTSVKSVVS